MRRFFQFLQRHVFGVFILGVITGLATNAIWESGKDFLDPCDSVTPIKQLGWNVDSGNKTNFCRTRGYDGSFNHGSYQDGGYCFTGDQVACVKRVTPGVR